MTDEFKKIMAFFSMDPEKKAHELEHVFENSIEFFEKFKEILQHGTPEQKQEVLNQVMQLQVKLQQETARMCEETGFSEEQLKEFAENKENFSTEEWGAIQAAKKKLNVQAEEISAIVPGNKSEGKGASKKGSSAVKKNKWMKS
jgi:hypothetical protein